MRRVSVCKNCRELGHRSDACPGLFFEKNRQLLKNIDNILNKIIIENNLNVEICQRVGQNH